MTKDVVVASARVADYLGEHADVAVGAMTLSSGALVVNRIARRHSERSALASSAG